FAGCGELMLGGFRHPCTGQSSALVDELPSLLSRLRYLESAASTPWRGAPVLRLGPPAADGHSLAGRRSLAHSTTSPESSDGGRPGCRRALPVGTGPDVAT